MALEITTFVLPFFFLLAIVYGAMEVGSPFKNKTVKLIISLAIAVFGATNEYAVATINQVMPFAAVFFVAVFFLKFITSFFDEKKPKDWTLAMIMTGIILMLVMRFGDQFSGELGFLPVSYQNIIGIFIVVVFVVFLYMAYKKGAA